MGTEIDDLVRARRFDEALALLYARAERAPSDRTVTQAIERIRERMADVALAELGPVDATPRLTRASMSGSAELGADERYLLGRVDGVRTIGQLVQSSTLGRYRTARVLVWLVSRGLVEIPSEPDRTTIVPSASSLRAVVVADSNGTQASLARTMLRVSLGRGVAFHTATDASTLLELAARERPELLLLDFRLPGRGDGIETLRALRATRGLEATRAIVMVTRIEADYVRARLPSQAALLIRPIERASLEAALQAAGAR